MNKSILLFLFLLPFAACRKDSLNVTEIDDEFEPPVVEVSSPLNASLFGIIEDESGVPIHGADVYLFDEKTTSNVYGQFFFSNVTMDKKGTLVRIRKEGYFDGFKKFYPKEDSENYTKIILLAKNDLGSFDSGLGGKIVESNGLEIDFPPNAVIKTSGESYNGIVHVKAQWLDPTDDFIHEKMPGNLEGLDDADSEVGLKSYSMAVIELESDLGEKLNLGNNQKATITFPVPLQLTTSAPDEIPLWSFDEALGIWKQEEENAILVGDKYIGQVSHFSFWNCDVPYPLIELSGVIGTANGVPIPAIKVCIRITATGETRCGVTDNEGFFIGKMPENESLTILIDDEDCVNFSQVIGSFSSDSHLGTINTNGSNEIVVTGEAVDCVGNPITEGLIRVYIDDYVYHYYIGGNNSFEFSVFKCNPDNGVRIDVLDFNSLEFSHQQWFSTASGTANLGVIMSCGNAIDEYIKITVDNEVRILSNPVAGYDPNLDTLLIRSGNWRFGGRFSQITGTGTYGNSNLDWVQLQFFNHPLHGVVNFYCPNSPCSEFQIDEFEITALGNSGEKTEGVLSGQLVVSNNPTPIWGDYEVEFSIVLD